MTISVHKRIVVSTVVFAKDKPVVLCKIPGEKPELPCVLLNSHYDVVPCVIDRWVRCPDPFA